MHKKSRACTLALCLLNAAWILAPFGSAAEPKWSDLVDGESHVLSTQGSERGTQGAGSKIVTFDGKTHIVWQDSTAKGYFARVRSFDQKTDSWSATLTLGEGADNHARPTITVDSRGHLHVIIGGHHTGLQYIKSVRPNDAREWTEVEKFGHTTYPVLVCGPGDTLYLTGRHDKNWAGMDFYVKPPNKPWNHRGLLVKKSTKYEWYAAYQNNLAWGPGQKTLHAGVGFYMGQESPGWGKPGPQLDMTGLYQAVGYMRSEDLGKTWERSDGSPIELPATTETVDMIAEGSRDPKALDKPKPAIKFQGLAVDSSNRPYLVYIRHTPDPGRAFLCTPDGKGAWRQLPLQAALDKHYPGMAAIECEVSITEENLLVFVFILVPIDYPAANWRPGLGGLPHYWTRDHPQAQRIAWLESSDGGHSWRTRRVAPEFQALTKKLPNDEKPGTLMPTLERPTGFNQISPFGPSLLYSIGLFRNTKKDEVIDDDVVWLRPRWQ